MYKTAKDIGAKQVLIGRVGRLLRDQFRDILPMINGIDLLLIPHLREEVETADQALIAQYHNRVVYAGPIVRQDRISSDDLRQRMGLTSEHKVILLTLGGGGWELANDLLISLLNARKQILESCPQARLVVIVGPHFGGKMPEVDEFVCYVSLFEPSFTSYLNLASVVVSMAGYNTINEVAASGLPAICVPTSEADDQIGRVEDFAQRFPNMVPGRADDNVLAYQVIRALGQHRDSIAVQKSLQQVEAARRSVSDEIKRLLGE